MKRIETLAIFLALAAPLAMAAEPMYRSVMPDGSVRYGEAPEPNARATKKIPPPPASTGTITVTPAERVRSFESPKEGGGGVVIPMPERKQPEASQQGRIQAPERLPQRSY